jgi:hypothetical protein
MSLPLEIFCHPDEGFSRFDWWKTDLMIPVIPIKNADRQSPGTVPSRNK